MKTRAHPISRARMGVDFQPVLGRLYSYKKFAFTVNADPLMARGFEIDFGRFKHWIIAPWWRDEKADAKMAMFYAMEFLDSLVFMDTGEVEKATSKSNQCQVRKHLIVQAIASKYPSFLIRAENTTGTEFTIERGLGVERGVFGHLDYIGDQIRVRAYYWTPDAMEMIIDSTFSAENVSPMLGLLEFFPPA